MSEPRPSALLSAIRKLNKRPAWLRPTLLNLAVRRAVPFTGTAGVEYLEMTPERVTLRLRNRRKARNHIRQVHAAATALLAETATGMVVGLNARRDQLPLLKHMEIQYVARSEGNLTAQATPPPELLAAYEQGGKGEAVIPVEIRDANGNQPVRCQLTWAWVVQH